MTSRPTAIRTGAYQAGADDVEHRAGRSHALVQRGNPRGRLVLRAGRRPGSAALVGPEGVRCAGPLAGHDLVMVAQWQLSSQFHAPISLFCMENHDSRMKYTGASIDENDHTAHRPKMATPAVSTASLSPTRHAAATAERRFGMFGSSRYCIHPWNHRRGLCAQCYELPPPPVLRPRTRIRYTV